MKNDLVKKLLGKYKINIPIMEKVYGAGPIQFDEAGKPKLLNPWHLELCIWWDFYNISKLNKNEKN